MEDLRRKVLVVEDDIDMLNLLHDRLKGMNYEVFKATDGQEAIDSLLVNKPDLVLLDMLLPKLSGIQFLERVRQYPDPEISSVPVIVLSNLRKENDVASAQSLKIEEYYVKSHTNLDDVFKKVGEIFQEQDANRVK